MSLADYCKKRDRFEPDIDGFPCSVCRRSGRFFEGGECLSCDHHNANAEPAKPDVCVWVKVKPYWYKAGCNGVIYPISKTCSKCGKPVQVAP